MRINKFVASSSSLSRRAVDQAILDKRITVNGYPASVGQDIVKGDRVTLDDQNLELPQETTTIMLHKPVGYVCSRKGQGSKTIYDLLPAHFQNLNTVGRLDKDSSGLLLLTNDGQLAHKLSHPKFEKTKQYIVKLNRALQPDDQRLISGSGVLLNDGQSKLELDQLSNEGITWKVTMHEGRNRQIRRSFTSVGYEVIELQRTTFGTYNLGTLPAGQWRQLS